MAEINAPQLVMVAGPNGSGKSTLIAALRVDPNIHLPKLYVNADDIQRERGLSDSLQAQQIANDLRNRALEMRGDVMYETVMSHPSKIAELQRAKTAGYQVTIHLIATEDPTVNEARVGARVEAGGHDVPRDRIRSRYERTLALAPVAIGYADRALVFDNTQLGDTGRGLAVHATLTGNRLVYDVPSPAKWVQTLADRVNERASEIEAFAKVQRLSPVLARLEGGATTGPIIAIGKHYVLQYDAEARISVLHDRVLLGEQGARIASQEVHRISYREGVAAIEGPQQTKTR